MSTCWPEQWTAALHEAVALVVTPGRSKELKQPEWLALPRDQPVAG